MPIQGLICLFKASYGYLRTCEANALKELKEAAGMLPMRP
jgi:hypothetical protein